MPGWTFLDSVVPYYDPYELDYGTLIIPSLSKNFRYAYQREYRFALFPPVAQSRLKEPLFLDLGALSCIAGLFRRDGTLIAGRKSGS